MPPPVSPHPRHLLIAFRVGLQLACGGLCLGLAGCGGSSDSSPSKTSAADSAAVDTATGGTDDRGDVGGGTADGSGDVGTGSGDAGSGSGDAGTGDAGTGDSSSGSGGEGGEAGGMGGTGAGDGSSGPQDCTEEAECVDACPTGSMGCTCHNERCVPTCVDDDDCPTLGTGVTLECREADGICVPPA